MNALALAYWIEGLLIPAILIGFIILACWIAPREDRHRQNINHKTIGSED